MMSGATDQPPGDGLVKRLARIAAGGGFVFGCSTAVISGAVTSIDAQLIQPLALSETARNAVSGLTVSSALFGCILGAPLAGLLSARYGRRTGMLWAAALFLISAVGSAVPELGVGRLGEAGAPALILFFAYRFVCGMAAGLISTLSPLYIVEIAPPAARGRLGTYFQLAVVSGVVAVYFTNWLIASGHDEHWLHAVGWRLMLGSTAVPALLFMVSLRSLSDTPRGLVLRGDSDRALDLLRRLTTEAQAKKTLREIQDSLTNTRGRLLSFGARMLVVGCVLAVFQQLTGINAILYYLPLLAEHMGETPESALLQTALVGGGTTVFTFVAMFGSDVWGRKPLLVLGAVIMSASMFALAGMLMNGITGLPALLAVGVFLSAFAFSWGPVLAVLLPEIYPNLIRSQALGLAMALQWIANILVSWSFRLLDGNSALNASFNHGLPYLIYGAMSLSAALFVWRCVPETKGRPLEEIQRSWT
jgi:SP family xylose:H+ symportor-like MFS transporter